MEKVIAQGAEAEIIHTGKFVIKHRVSKGYRHPELDKRLIKSRTKSEAKLLTKASEIINSPKPFFVPVTDFARIKMPFIKGKKLSETLDNLKNRFKVMEQVGEETAKLHNADIIHGDLTTSNMILVENNENASKNNQNKPIKQSQKKSININSEFKVYIIDFGLGFISKRAEDKAVDLHLIKQALEAKHFREHEKLFASFLKGYKKEKEASKILEQLKQVELRGRYKH